MNKLATWADKWLIELNIKKCIIVSYGRSIEHNYPYYINNV